MQITLQSSKPRMTVLANANTKLLLFSGKQKSKTNKAIPTASVV
jgi:hypothetical protein